MSFSMACVWVHDTITTGSKTQKRQNDGTEEITGRGSCNTKKSKHLQVIISGFAGPGSAAQRQGGHITAHCDQHVIVLQYKSKYSSN